MNNFLKVLLASLLVLTVSCSSDEDVNESSKGEETTESEPFIYNVSSLEITDTNYTNSAYHGYEFDYTIEKVSSSGKKEYFNSDIFSKNDLDIKIDCPEFSFVNGGDNSTVDKNIKMIAVKSSVLAMIPENKRATACNLVFNFNNQKSNISFPFDLDKNNPASNLLDISSTSKYATIKDNRIMIDEITELPTKVSFNIKGNNGTFTVKNKEIIVKKNITKINSVKNTESGESVGFNYSDNKTVFTYSFRSPFPNGKHDNVTIVNIDNKTVTYAVHFGTTDLSEELSNIRKLAPGSTENLRVLGFVIDKNHPDFNELKDIKTLSCERSPEKEGAYASKEACEKIILNIEPDGENKILNVALPTDKDMPFYSLIYALTFKDVSGRIVAIADVLFKKPVIDKDGQLPFMFGTDPLETNLFDTKIVEVPYSDYKWKLFGQDAKPGDIDTYISKQIGIVHGYGKYVLNGDKLTVTDRYNGRIDSVTFKNSTDSIQNIKLDNTESKIDCSKLVGTTDDNVASLFCELNYIISYPPIVPKDQAAVITIKDNSKTPLTQTIKIYTEEYKDKQ